MKRLQPPIVHRFADGSVAEVPMHCPNCATKASGEQKFCRSCGMRLEKVQQILSEEISAAELNVENKIRRFEHWRNVAALWTVATFVAVVLTVLIRRSEE